MSFAALFLACSELQLTSFETCSDSLIPSHLFTTTLNGISSATANLTTEQKANATVTVTIELDESGLIKVGKATLILREEDEDVASKGGVAEKLKGLFNKFGSNKDKESTTATSSSAGAESTAESGKEDTGNSTLTDEEQLELEEFLKRSQLPPAKTKLVVETVQPIEGGAMSTEEKSEVKKR